MEMQDSSNVKNLRQLKSFFTYMIDAIGSQKESLQQSEIMAFQREVKEEITMKLLFINKKIKVKKATILKVSIFVLIFH